MTQPRDGNALLMGSGGTPWAKFPQPGAVVVGRIVGEPEARQQTDFDSGEPKEWPNGDPMMEVVVLMQTGERDPEIEDDDGTRALHIRNKMQVAVRDAVRATGAEGLEVGGTLTVEYIGDGEAVGRKKPPKLYRARYVRPVSAGNGALMTGNGSGPGVPAAAAPGNAWTAPAPPAPPAPPTPQPAPLPPSPPQPAPPPAYAPHAAAPTVEPAPPGVDPAVWARMDRDQRAAILAAFTAAAAPTITTTTAAAPTITTTPAAAPAASPGY